MVMGLGIGMLVNNGSEFVKHDDVYSHLNIKKYVFKLSQTWTQGLIQKQKKRLSNQLF